MPLFDGQNDLGVTNTQKKTRIYSSNSNAASSLNVSPHFAESVVEEVCNIFLTQMSGLGSNNIQNS